jgi:hypothetical protein
VALDDASADRSGSQPVTSPTPSASADSPESLHSSGSNGDSPSLNGDSTSTNGKHKAKINPEALLEASELLQPSELLEPSELLKASEMLSDLTPEAEASVSLLAREFTTLAGSLLNATTVAGVLSRVVETAIAVVPGADLVSVTMRTGEGRFVTPVQTDELASALDDIQYDANEGPCVDATRTPGLGVTSCPDLKSGSPWQVFGPKAADAGVRAVFAAGLFPEAGPPRMGALNFYSFKANGLDGVDQDIALLLAAHASVALAGTQAVTAAELEAAQLRQALESRDVIGQAKGILMQRRGVSADEAFGILRDASQNLNMKLADIARTVAERHPDL